MATVTIKLGGALPIGDGDVNFYESPELKGNKHFDAHRRAIFVNGMANSPTDHQVSANALSTLQACPVIGVYNQTDGFWKDLGQCITDKAKFSITIQDIDEERNSAKRWNDIYNAWKQFWNKAAPTRTFPDFIESKISANPATVALYRLLRDGNLGVNSNVVQIFAHSQGNLITSNALTAVALADGLEAIKGRVINSFGSPCRFWPPGIDHRNHAFTFDPVSWLDFDVSFSNIKVGGVFAHSFLTYMKYDPEWVINRFRWGSFGFTANMDEDGLANALVEIGNNPNRLYGVFDRLNKAHWSDKDDVTLLYVKKMRSRGGEAMLKMLARTKPELIDVMIDCLVGGRFTWNSAEEKKQADYLKTLKN